MKRVYILVVLLGAWNTVFSQDNCEVESKFQVEAKTLIGSKGKLPFWLWVNQMGRIEQNEDLSQNFELSYKNNSTTPHSGLSYSYGGRVNANISADQDVDLNELFGGLIYKKIFLKVGKWNDIQLFDGLSSSNKNLISSRNARSYPKLRVGLNDFVGRKFRIKAFWEEGLLNDKRWVDDTRLHHKALYCQFGKIENLQITFGGEHLVMWGGRSTSEGELPSSFSDYLRVIRGKSGDNNSLAIDQANVMGNHLGVYNLSIEKSFISYDIEFYLSHPFEDNSGMELDNYKDNLYGIHFKNNKKESVLQNVVLEHLYSKNQSGKQHLVKKSGTDVATGRGRDRYYNHEVYSSGFTYHGMVMTSPLFGPVQYNEDGIPIQITNNLISAWHLGMNGYLNEQLKWELKLTHSKNGGTMDVYYPSNRSQFSSLLGFSYQCPKLPMTLKLDMALDKGELWDDGVDTTRFGGAFTIAYTL
ncbi:hypothetical protein EYV94_19935 [Puteibacter caeruleilacunae]|nr:hypothetical protein EYV94_19935 [Puteibacter caeruleilacunae]